MKLRRKGEAVKIAKGRQKKLYYAEVEGYLLYGDEGKCLTGLSERNENWRTKSRHGTIEAVWQRDRLLPASTLLNKDTAAPRKRIKITKDVGEKDSGPDQLTEAASQFEDDANPSTSGSVSRPQLTENLTSFSLSSFHQVFDDFAEPSHTIG